MKISSERILDKCTGIPVEREPKEILGLTESFTSMSPIKGWLVPGSPLTGDYSVPDHLNSQRAMGHKRDHPPCCSY